MTWSRQAFDTRASHGPIHRVGYVSGAFGISKYRREWGIFHLPTGMSFMYSWWPTLREARLFADSLLGEGDWADKKLDRHPDAFNVRCHAIADSLGINRRRAYAI